MRYNSLMLDKWLNTIQCMDCLEGMKQLPDKCIDLVLTDPPYGIGEDGGDKQRRRGYGIKVRHEKIGWDKERVSAEYIREIFRISKYQIIFGANYYCDLLPPTMGWIFWDKKIGGDFSDGELIFTSFQRALRKVEISYHHGLAGGHKRIHPTQKPTELIRWIITNYGEGCNLICDPFMGSGTTARACKDLGRDFIGFEKHQKYVDGANKRLQQEVLF